MPNQTKPYAMIRLILALLALLPIEKVFSEAFHPSQQVIKHISETLQQKLQAKVFTQDFVRVTCFVNDVIEPHTDFDKIAPLVLGKHWKTATPKEKERFKKEFQTLLIRAYSRACVESSDWTIQYLTHEVAKDAAKVLVKTTVLQRSLQPVEVNYRMFLVNGEWKTYDILIDGVSLVTNYRSTFNDKINKSGSLTAVIDDLAIRNADALKGKHREY